MVFKRRLACSFCGKRNDDVGKLVAGPRVYICDQCVAIAARLMEESGPPTQPSERPSGLFSRIATRISRVFGTPWLRRSDAVGSA